MKRFFLLFLLTFVFLFHTLFTPSTAGPLKKPLFFQHITQKEGLSSNMVFSIAIHGEEVWFGTYEGGATLYDRSKKVYKHYTPKGEPAIKVDDGDSIRWKNHLAYNHVSVIVPDTDRIWFGTYFYGFGGGGISYFSPQGSPHWKKFNTNNDRAKKVVSMALDGESVWVGSEKGLSLFDRKRAGWQNFTSLQ